jgi:hypothetical protein
MLENQVYLLILVNFLAPRSGSAFPKPIWIQESQINADPQHQCYGSGMFIPDPGSDIFPSRIPVLIKE